jgi:hypothetical protein
VSPWSRRLLTRPFGSRSEVARQLVCGNERLTGRRTAAQVRSDRALCGKRHGLLSSMVVREPLAALAVPGRCRCFETLWRLGCSACEAGSAGTPRIDMRGLGVRVVLAPTPQLWEVPTMSESMALVGLDVHQAQTVAAVLDPGTGELRVQRLRGEPAKVVPVFLEDLDCAVRAVYEAGPTGSRWPGSLRNAALTCGSWRRGRSRERRVTG